MAHDKLNDSKFTWKGLALHYGKRKTPVLTLIADATYPHLFRIRYPDGWTSTPANLSRAKDAAWPCQTFVGGGKPRRGTQGGRKKGSGIMGGDAGKHNAQRTEKLRCLKYGSVIRLCRGHFPKGVFPDDLMGRAHLFELVCVASLAPACADQKVEHLIGLWAPWMPAGEVLKEAPCLPVHHRALAQPQRHRQDSVLH